MPWKKLNWSDLMQIWVISFFISGAQIDFFLIMLLIYEAPEPKSIVSVEEVGNRF